MHRLLIVLGTLAALTVPALAADDPIAVRKALMQANGSGAAIAGAVMKGELEYSPVIGKAAINASAAAAQAFGDYFPEGTLDDERTTAAPKIWEDMAGFQAELDKLKSATQAAVEMSGKDGPADAEAFAAAMKPVLGTCKNCHETYRIEK